MIETTEQFEQVRLALERRSPQELAAFILTLSHAPNGIGSYVHAFAITDDSDAATDVIRNEIDSLRKGERDYDYRHRRSFMVVSRLRHVLDAIELALLPRKPASAVEMLTWLIESDAEISAHCFEDDFGAEQAFSRACDLFRLAAQRLPNSAVQPILDRLRSRDNCGLRSRLDVDT